MSGTLNITSGNTFVLNGTNALKLNGGGILNINTNAVFDTGGESEVSGGSAPAVNIYGTFITRDAQGFTGVNTSLPGIIPKIFAGSTIEYGRAGDQEVSIRADYKNITLSGSGTKNIPTCSPTGTVLIKDNVTADASNKTFGDSATNLTMTGGRLKVGGTGTKPDIAGTYTLTDGVIEFTNSGSTKETIRSPLTYYNIEVSGSNVANSKGITTVAGNGYFKIKTGGNFENSGFRLDGTTDSQTFIMEAGATFKTGVKGGFSGNDSAAIKSFETLIIDPKSTIIYSRSGDQTVTSLANYPFFRLEGSGNKVVMDGTVTIASAADSVIIDTTVVLKINSGAKVDFHGRPVLLKSGKAGNGTIGEIVDGTSALLNATNVTVERFIPAKRSFRFLSSPVNTTGTIKTNWMEGAVNAGVYSINDPNPGYGTNITGSNPAANGFDPTIKNNPSLFTFNTELQQWKPVLNTGDKLQAGKAYRLLVRGNRSTDMTTPDNNPVATNTILRTTGTLFTGTFTPAISTVNNGFTFIGNPYASPIDFKKIFTNATGISASYYVWDSKLNEQGAYVVYNAIHDTTNSKISEVNKNIQPGQAFFVKTTGSSPSLQILESYKSTGHANVFRVPDAQTKLDMQLLLNLEGGTESNADGAVVFFSSDFTTALADDDSYKLTNPDENIAIDHNGIALSIEGRPSITADDTIPLAVWQLKSRSYYLKLNGVNFSPDITAFIRDKYLNKDIPVSLSGATLVSFSIDSAVSNSYAKDRFTIIFKAAKILPVTITKVKAYAKENGIQIEWATENESNIKEYEIQVAANGQPFEKVATITAKDNSTTAAYNWLDESIRLGSNFYRIKITEKSGAVKYSNAAEVKLAGHNGVLTLLCNPIKNNIINVGFNNIEKGTYSIILYNNIGQQLHESHIEHSGSLKIYSISLLQSIIKGTYTLHIAKGKIIINKKIVIQ